MSHGGRREQGAGSKVFTATCRIDHQARWVAVECSLSLSRAGIGGAQRSQTDIPRGSEATKQGGAHYLHAGTVLILEGRLLIKVLNFPD